MGKKNKTNYFSINNKKAQYYQKPSYSSVHPVLILGIIIFCFPFLTPVIGFKIEGLVQTMFNMSGIGLILLGGVLSIYKANH